MFPLTNRQRKDSPFHRTSQRPILPTTQKIVQAARTAITAPIPAAAPAPAAQGAVQTTQTAIATPAAPIPAPAPAAMLTHSDLAIQHGKASEALKELLNTLENPQSTPDATTNAIQRLKTDAPRTFASLKSQLETQGNIELNPRLLLNLVNQYGQPALESLYNFHHQQQNIHADLSKIEHLKTQIQGLSTNPTPSTVENTQREFCSLSCEACEFLCRRVWELDQRSPDPRFVGPDYGKLKILSDPKILMTYQGAPLLDTYTRALELSISRQLPSNFINQPCTITRSDTLQVADEKKFLRQVQTVQRMLADPACPKSEINRCIAHTSLPLFHYLCKSAWLACGEPQGDARFGEHWIFEDPRKLLLLKNMEGVDILEQLRHHFTRSIEDLQALDTLTKVQEALSRGDNQSAKGHLERLPYLQDKLAHEVWFRDGGRSNPRFGTLTYGIDAIRANPSTLLQGGLLKSVKDEIEARVESLDTSMGKVYEELHSVPLKPADIRVETIALPQEITSRQLRVAMVTAELKPFVSKGGLAGAVYGLAKALGNENTTVIMPYFKRQIDPALKNLRTQGRILQDIQEEPTYTVSSCAGTAQKVYSVVVAAKSGDTSGIKCYFIEDDMQFHTDNIYAEDEEKQRFSTFQVYAADLSMKLYRDRKIDVLHMQDSQTGLVPEIIAQRYHSEWVSGESPATVFTFHNNSESSQVILYNGHGPSEESMRIFSRFGLDERQLKHAFRQGIERSEVANTVSETFAKEAQSALLGRGVESIVKQAALRHKVYGILNGNDPDEWNPKTNAMLKKWKGPNGTDTETDLTYGPEDPDQVIAEKKQKAKGELVRYFEARNKELIAQGKPPVGSLDPNKPLLTYIGRLDAFQKGLDKLPFFIEAALEQNAQVVIIGTDPCPKAKKILEEIRRDIQRRGITEGVIVLEDTRTSVGKLRWQVEYEKADSSKVPGMGPLLRAATDIGCFPSSYEPCGLVQGETGQFGGRVIATHTGGFADTVPPETATQYGITFAKAPTDLLARTEAHQARAIKEAVREALREFDNKESPEFKARTKEIMQAAFSSTWTQTPNGSSTPKEQYERIYHLAVKRKTLRGAIYFDGHL